MEQYDTYFDPNKDTDTTDNWTPGCNDSTKIEGTLIIIFSIVICVGAYLFLKTLIDISI